MFTGLVEGLGTVLRSEARGSGRRIDIQPPAELTAADAAALGDSVAVNGCCLTVVEIAHAGWSFDVGEESLNRTNLGSLQAGSRVNLERALLASARLGGHFVQGHVDGRGTVSAIELDGEWTTMTFAVAPGLSRYMVEKGSIAVDGVSLTIVKALPESFSVMLIPHTLGATTLGGRRVGDAVNLEVDLLAKYVERLLTGRNATNAELGAG
jgi:riboflavin synthase